MELWTVERGRAVSVIYVGDAGSGVLLAEAWARWSQGEGVNSLRAV